MGLMVNGEWNNFRRGQPINPAEYFEGQRLNTLQRILERRQTNPVLNAADLNIAPEDMPRFQQILQDETTNVYLGSIETIDTKLENVMRNLDELFDPDLYPDETDKKVVEFLKNHIHQAGLVKTLNKTLAMTFQELSGRPANLSPEERDLQQVILKEFSIATIDDVKAIQDRLKPFGTTITLLQNKIQVDEQIAELRKRLTPAAEVVAVFGRLGENFELHSGAYALNQDLSYLEETVVKNEDKVSPEELGILQEYLQKIRGQMTVLESTFEGIKAQFTNAMQGTHVKENELLQKQFEEISRIINSKQTSVELTSRVTNNLNSVIENIRACLSCTTRGINNDANLSYGEPNKFFAMSNTAKAKGSVADEIVYLAPTTLPNGQAVAFVLDNIYGSKSSDVLIGHISAVAKKYQQLKVAFPEARLGIYATAAAMQSVGISPEVLTKRLQDAGITLAMEPMVATVTIPESSLGDPYLEFGGPVRTPGARQINGLFLN